jgi:hypothetical protein
MRMNNKLLCREKKSTFKCAQSGKGTLNWTVSLLIINRLIFINRGMASDKADCFKCSLNKSPF